MQWACLTSCCFQRVMTVSDRRCCRHNSAVVRSPRRAARETFALNSGLNFLGFAMTGYLLSYRVSPLIRAPSFWGAVQTALILGGPFGGRRVGLPLEGLLEHAFGEYFPNGDDEVFDSREFGAPSRTVGTPDLFDEIFGDAVKIGSNFIDGGR